MDSGVYSAAAAMDTIMRNHEVVAQNLANATVPGYRRRGLSFEIGNAAAARGNPAQSSSTKTQGPAAGRVFSSFEAGTLQATGNPLDVAIKGDGFFVVQGPKGDLYTRNGGFQVGPNGRLQTRQGLPVMGTSGTIQLPTTVAKITISADGTVTADKTKAGQIRVVSFTDPKQLEPAGTTLFTAPASAQQKASKSSIEQGYREGSNVQIVNEMVSMIAGMRHYEALQKAIQAISDAMQQNTRPQAA